MLNKVIDIVKEASKFCDRNSMDIYCKGGNSNFVTTVDLNVEKFLGQKLSELIPESGFVGEESDPSDLDKEYLWVVDPIDGTANFIREYGLSAISVGLVKNKEPYIGVVLNPITKDIWYAERNKGAYKNGKPIHVSDRDYSHSCLCIGFALYHKELQTPCFKILERVYAQCDDMRRLGSAALEMVSLASGCAELYFEIKISPWDYMGATAILLEAGGVLEPIGRKDLSFDKTPITLIAANNKENLEKLKVVVQEEVAKVGIK